MKKNLKIGYAFGDQIKVEYKQFKHHGIMDGGTNRILRGKMLLLILSLSVVMLLLRVLYLQIFQGSYYRILSDANRTRTKIIHAPRGIILDRNNVPLVLNIPGYRDVKHKKSEIISHEKAIERLAKGDLSLETDSLRKYPFADSMAQVLGYLGQISPEELASSKFATYRGSDFIGKAGIERTYEAFLRGTDGKQLLEVDATGKTVRSLGQTDPVPGENITLSLDSKLQIAAYEAMKDVKTGALVASRPDGEILAMVSKPSFDPNLFTLDNTYKTGSQSAYPTIASILNGENQPLLNRAIGGTYPPASTFKIITAAAGLEKKVIDANFSIIDTGIIQIGAFSFSNWYYSQYGKTETGPVDVSRALARSNDIFFYKLAGMVQVDRLSEIARKFGVGEKLGIDLAGEASGILPTKAWKQEYLKEAWYLGDTFHYGIGQGYLLMTPLQVNAMTSVIANKGILYTPLLKLQKPKIKEQKFLSDPNINLIKKGMIEACETGGTAWPLFDFKVKNPKAASSSADLRLIKIACKTGTAQHGGEKTLPHAWITLFAPAENPEIVLTVLKEASGEGSNEAGPIAKKFLEAYFSNK